LEKKVTSIDEVIMLLDYIDSLKRQDNKIADITIMIDDLSKRMKYIESVQIMFEHKQYSDYLEILNWPKTFMQYIEERKQELLAQREELYKQMRREIDIVFEKVKEFRSTIQQILDNEGLVEKEDTEDEDDESLDSNGSVRKLTEEQEEARRLEA
jgi:hypothetical protein